MALAAGTRLGPYEIVSPLGAGGMGQVYRGRDTRLERTVAIKVLPPHLAGDPELRRRFEREARVISSLSHPHICTLFDVGQDRGTDYLVMELLEGETLARRLARGPLPVEQALKTGLEIADALEQAHKQGAGVVHRDLKPANIMLTRTGAKLLDFGLAKYTQAPAQRAALSSLATEEEKITDKGEIVGTFQYMAPEQLEGKDADARTDIFALGSVLYEMVTGRPAFTGKTRASLIANIMNAEPPAMAALQPLTPPALDRIVKTCLAKDPDERWQTAHDAKLELKWVLEGGSEAGVPAPVLARRKQRERTAWGLAAVLAVVAGAFAWGFMRRAPQLPQVLRFQIQPPEKHSFDYLVRMSVSPDGTQVAFLAMNPAGVATLWVQPLDSTSAHHLEGTDGANEPVWSPDSRFLLFAGGGKLKRVSAGGGAVETLCDIPGRPLTWNRAGAVLFFAEGKPIQRISTDDCSIRPATRPDANYVDQDWAWFLPDGRHFLYAGIRADKKHEIVVGSLDSDASRVVLRNAAAPTYVAPGFLLFARDGYLLAQAFDASRLELGGEAFPVLKEQLAFAGVYGLADYSASSNGVLVYHEQPSTTFELTWWDRGGKRLNTIGPPDLWADVRLSPDGKRVLANRGDPRTHAGDLWMSNAEHPPWSRITSYSAPGGVEGVWSADGGSVIYLADLEGKVVFSRVALNAASAPEVLLTANPNSGTIWDWSPDGRFLVYEVENGGVEELWMLPLTGDRKPVPFRSPQFPATEARFSPDGRWLAYTSEETGSEEIFVMSFAGSGPRMQVSSGGGRLARWNPNGKELLYLSLDGKVMSVPLTLGERISSGQPQALFTVRSDSDFAVAPDGKRLLVMENVGRPVTPLTVVVNWQEGTKK